MADEKSISPELLATLQTLMNQNKSAAGGWAAAKAQCSNEPEAVMIPVSLDTEHGKVKIFLQFPGTAAASPEALFALINDLIGKGIPVDTWQKKENWNSGGSSWGGKRNYGFNR